MSRFNPSKTAMPEAKETNLAGGAVYPQDPELELAQVLLTSFCNDMYYESFDAKTERFRTAIGRCSPEYVAKASIYARDKFNMRSITHLCAVELCRFIHNCVPPNGHPWLRTYFRTLPRRVDDITEILACWESLGEKSRPSAMIRGLGDAFAKFDGYQLAKYRGEGKKVSLIDAVRLCHPVPTDKNRDALAALVVGTLKQKRTWEAKVSAAGGDKEKKSEAWAEMVNSGQLGYFALLRNLRNIAEHAPEAVQEAYRQLVDENAIRKSRVFPFRFYTAIKTLMTAAIQAQDGFTARSLRLVAQGCDAAMKKSLANVPDLPNTLVAVDVSGSMDNTVSGGNITLAEAGMLFGVALAEKGYTNLMRFASDAVYAHYMPGGSIAATVEAQSRCEGVGGHGTNFHAILEKAGKRYDRIVVFSDMQCWMEGNEQNRFRSNIYGYAHAENVGFGKTYETYCRKWDVKPWVYLVNLADQGGAPLPQEHPKVVTLAGWSEKLFDLMAMAEQDPHALKTAIWETRLDYS